jgi:hypothetical protein
VGITARVESNKKKFTYIGITQNFYAVPASDKIMVVASALTLKNLLRGKITNITGTY